MNTGKQNFVPEPAIHLFKPGFLYHGKAGEMPAGLIHRQTLGQDVQRGLQFCDRQLNHILFNRALHRTSELWNNS